MPAPSAFAAFESRVIGGGHLPFKDAGTFACSHGQCRQPLPQHGRCSSFTCISGHRSLSAFGMRQASAHLLARAACAHRSHDCVARGGVLVTVQASSAGLVVKKADDGETGQVFNICNLRQLTAHLHQSERRLLSGGSCPAPRHRFNSVRCCRIQVCPHRTTPAGAVGAMSRASRAALLFLSGLYSTCTLSRALPESSRHAANLRFPQREAGAREHVPGTAGVGFDYRLQQLACDSRYAQPAGAAASHTCCCPHSLLVCNGRDAAPGRLARRTLAALRLRGGATRHELEHELRQRAQEDARAQRLERARAAARARRGSWRGSWRDALRRTWRTIKKAIMGRATTAVSSHASPLQARHSAGLSADPLASRDLAGSDGAPAQTWDWMQASQDLKRQREIEMVKDKRSGVAGALHREEDAAAARPLSHAMAALRSHIDGRRAGPPGTRNERPRHH